MGYLTSIWCSEEDIVGGTVKKHELSQRQWFGGWEHSGRKALPLCGWMSDESGDLPTRGEPSGATRLMCAGTSQLHHHTR